MAKPFSFRTEPWVSLDKCADSIFSDDFVHDKLLTVKTTHISTKGTANLKATLSQSGDEFKVAEEIKLWFPVWSRGGSLYFKSKGKDLKILYDDGVSAWSLKELWSLNTYGSVQTNKNLRNVVLKAGANVITPEWVFGTRIRYGLNEESGSLSWGNKIHWAKGDWSIAAYDHVSLNSMSLLSNALRIGYAKDSNLFFLRAENNLSRSLKHLNLSNPDFYFTDFTADWLRNVDINTKAGVEVTGLLFRLLSPDWASTTFPLWSPGTSSFAMPAGS